MSGKWAVAYEYDLEQGLCFLARKNGCQGEVALFPSRKEAEDWATSGQDLDPDLWEFNYINLENVD